jgi:HEAT repeat protein
VKRYHILSTSLAVLLAGVTLQAAEQPDVQDLIKELTGEGPAAQRTLEQLDAVYAQVLDALMPDMAGEDAAKYGFAADTLERIAFHAGRPGAEADRAACSEAIATRLGPEAGQAARVWLIRQLERVGRAEAVPPLAKALGDKDPLVRESARRALQKNPAKEANTALQEALASATEPAWRAALLNALAERRDPANLDLLLKEAAAENDKVRTAAVIGLAKLGEKPAVDAIEAAMTRGSPRARQTTAHAYQLLTDALAAKGDKPAALAMYKNMLAAGGPTRCAAVVGIGRTGGAAELPTILAAAADEDARVRNASVEALRLCEGQEVAGAIVAKLHGAEPAAKVALLRALVLRGDRNAVPAAFASLADDDVRDAALRALGQMIDAPDLPKLTAVAVEPKNPEDAKPAAAALKAAAMRMADRDGTIEKLMAATANSPVDARTMVLEIVADMGGSKALQAVAAAAKSSDLQLQDVGSRLLGEWMTPDAAPVLLDLAKTAGDEKYKIRALRGYIRIGRQFDVPDAQRIETVRAAMRLAQRDEEKKLAVDVLRRVPTKECLAMAVSLLRNPTVKVEAADVAVAIGGSLVGSEPAAVAAAMKQVITAGVEGDLAGRAKALLDKAQAAGPK